MHCAGRNWVTASQNLRFEKVPRELADLDPEWVLQRREAPIFLGEIHLQ